MVNDSLSEGKKRTAVSVLPYPSNFRLDGRFNVAGNLYVTIMEGVNVYAVVEGISV